jgi:hypothetical protein
MGVSGAALQYMTKDALAEVTDDPSDEVPRLAYLLHEDRNKDARTDGPPERKPVYYTIPYDRWERIEGTNQAFRKLKEKLSDQGLDKSIKMWVTSHPTEIRQIKIEYFTKQQRASPDEFEKILDKLPETTSAKVGTQDRQSVVEEIPIKLTEVQYIKKARTREKDDEVNTQSDYFDEAYEDIPAGCAMTGKRGGTVGFEAMHGNQNVLITAAHNFIYPWEDGSDLTVGQDMNQPQYQKNKAGELSDWIYNGEYAEDAAKIELAPNKGTSNYHAAKG